MSVPVYSLRLNKATGHIDGLDPLETTSTSAFQRPIDAAQIHHGYFLVDLDPKSTAVITTANALLEDFFGADEVQQLNGIGNSKFGFKRLPQKQRMQFRTAGAKYIYAGNTAVPDSESMKVTYHFPAKFSLQETKPDLVKALLDVALLLHKIAIAAINCLLADIDIDTAKVVQKYCDESFFPTSRCSTSVLNSYSYNNDEASTDSGLQNCAVHTDPGLITVLGRGSAPGLQINHKQLNVARCTGIDAYNSKAPDIINSQTDVKAHSSNGDEWVFVEPLMKPNQVGVLIGESLRRLSGEKLPACLHRVVSSGDGSSRQNIIFELRPHTNIFEAWPGNM